MFTSGLFSISRKSADQCPGCGLETSPRQFCPGCADDLHSREPACRFCGTPVKHPGMICGQCLQHTHDYDRLWCVNDYLGPLATLIKRLKYQDQLALAPPLGTLMAQTLTTTGLAHWEGRVTAMPMHPTRLRHRGFNHARLLAEVCAKALSAPFEEPLARILPTPPLEGLTRKERQAAVRRAFSSAPVEGAWLLVDDVFTTGATANAAARALKEAGARQVDLLCLARTPIRGDNHRNWLNQAFRDTPAAEDD